MIQYLLKKCRHIEVNAPKFGRRFVFIMYKCETEHFKPVYFKGKYNIFADLQNFKPAKKWVRKSKILKLPHFCTKFSTSVSPQICGFANCGTYLRTAQLLKLIKMCFCLILTGMTAEFLDSAI